MKYLSRNRIYKKAEPSKNAKKIYLVCEGERREVDYFRFFQGLVSNIDIIPIPNVAGRSDPQQLNAYAEEFFVGDEDTTPVYELSFKFEDEVWFVIDTDRWNEGRKIEALWNFVRQRNKRYEGWFVVQSNPSFEIWLYYHFYSDRPQHKDIQNFTSFKEFVSSKISGGFDNRKMPLEIQNATANAKSNFQNLGEQPDLYSTEVFILAQQLIRFTKPVLDECLRMQRKELITCR